MWLVADLFERYTTSVAKTFLKIAAREADANRKALEDYRKRRHDRVAHVVAADRRTAEVTQAAAKPAESVAPKAAMSPAPIVPEPATLEPAAPEPAMEAASAPLADASTVAAAPSADVSAQVFTAELPMGVRGDVVSAWVERLTSAAPGEVADLTETLRKDKKVRVPELQWIAVGVLHEEPAVRKKADHLSALREKLASPAGRSASAMDGPLSIHA